LESKKEYTVEKHKECAMEELLERGYTKEVIEEWIQHIE
jgi:SOS response regulatory protein OraA/RecX